MMKMKTAKELKGSRLVAKVRLHNYRFPRSKIESGNYAIIVFDVILNRTVFLLSLLIVHK